MQSEESNHALHKLINSLYNSQPISNHTINQLDAIDQPELLCHFGLINLLHSIICRQKTLQAQPHKTDMKEKPMNDQILLFRGEILRHYVNIAQKFLPNPAFYLASFDFQSFNSYCMKRGLTYLFRHSRGIYPLIDTAKTTLLQFLPFCEQIKEGQPAIIGNQNWQLARKSLEAFFDSQVKTGRVEKNGRQMENGETKMKVDQLDEERGDSQAKEKNGIRLCYMMLAGRKQQMKQYIVILNDYYVLSRGQSSQDVSQVREMIRKFASWYKNYEKFIQDGLKFYSGKIDLEKRLFYPTMDNSVEQTIIMLIQQIFQLRGASVQGEGQQKIDKIRLHFIKMIQYSKQLGGVLSNLFLCYIHAISNMIQLHPPLDTKSLYLELNGKQISHSDQEPFNRVMFSDTQLLQLYQKEQVSDFPSSFNFGNDLLAKILRIICRKDNGKAVQNLQRFELFSSVSQRLKMLVCNQRLQQCSANPQKNEGEKIMKYIEKNMETFQKILVDRNGFHVDKVKARQFLVQFIRQWRVFYNYLLKFSHQKFLLLKDIFQKEQFSDNQMMQQNRNMEGKVSIDSFQMPLKNPYVLYKIISQLLAKVEEQKQRYLRLFDECAKSQQHLNAQQLSSSKSMLKEYLQLFKKATFKSMIQFANPQPDSENTQKKDEFEDRVWRVYANIMLILPQSWNNLIGPSHSQQQLRQKENQNARFRFDVMQDEEKQYEIQQQSFD